VKKVYTSSTEQLWKMLFIDPAALQECSKCGLPYHEHQPHVYRSQAEWSRYSKNLKNKLLFVDQYYKYIDISELFEES
jgi:hypothetical protein